jgi:hypothetical protein
MQRIIALRPLSKDREPLVHTISLRKNINSLGQPQEALSSSTKGPSPTLLLRLLREVISRPAALFTGPRCGVISGRLFRISAKTTQILRPSKMEAKSILTLVLTEEEEFQFP